MALDWGNIPLMQIGAVYPQTELPTDRGAVRAFVQGVEELGFRHIVAYDHVLGADPDVHTDWPGPYDVDTPFHEPLVLFGFMAAFTSLELVTGIIVAPQRQTALLAKQAAEVDILTEGRFRLGLGIGWNRVEYEALGQDFATRGRREEEQIGLLRRLWTERAVTHHGRFDLVTGAGLAPLPVQRPIPIWLGGRSAAAYKRIGRLADGWFPRGLIPGPALDEALGVIGEAATNADRDPSSIGMEALISLRPDTSDDLVHQLEQWQDAGATHVDINTMGSGWSSVDAHLEALTRVGETLRHAMLIPAPDSARE
jgi:probable F420-dependent oxidoreductase